MPQDVTFGELSACLHEALLSQKPKDTLVTLIPLDIYSAQTEPTKNVSFRLSITSIERTLKSSEVNDLLDQVADSAAKQFGAVRL